MKGDIKLRDLGEILIVFILLSTFQLVYMVLTVNKPDLRRIIASIESADWNRWVWDLQVIFFKYTVTTSHPQGQFDGFH